MSADILTLTSNEPTKGRAFSHDRGQTKTKHEWLTPRWLIEALGPFDLDPCASSPRPWPTAKVHFDVYTNGLMREWHGRVFCNPPYENEIAGKFLARCAAHNNAVALIYARTETENWFDHIWAKAHGILFLKGRITFCHVDGTAASSGGGAPSALIAYGQANADQLRHLSLTSKVPGHYLVP